MMRSWTCRSRLGQRPDGRVGSPDASISTLDDELGGEHLRLGGSDRSGHHSSSSTVSPSW